MAYWRLTCPRNLGLIAWELSEAMRYVSDQNEFGEQYNRRLTRIPHPRQNYPLLGSRRMEPIFDDVQDSHLDTMWRCFVALLLVDEEFGVLQFARDDAERQVVGEVTALYFDLIDGKATRDAAFQQILDQGDESSDEMYSANKAAWLACTLIIDPAGAADELIRCVLGLLDHKDLPWVKREKGDDAWFIALEYIFFPVLWIAIVWMNRSRHGRAPHARLLASVFNETFLIEWLAESDRENELLQEHLSGNFERSAEYYQCLKSRWVEPEHIETMPRIFARFKAARSTASRLRDDQASLVNSIGRG